MIFLREIMVLKEIYFLWMDYLIVNGGKSVCFRCSLMMCLCYLICRRCIVIVIKIYDWMFVLFVYVCLVKDMDVNMMSDI